MRKRPASVQAFKLKPTVSRLAFGITPFWVRTRLASTSTWTCSATAGTPCSPRVAAPVPSSTTTDPTAGYAAGVGHPATDPRERGSGTRDSYPCRSSRPLNRGQQWTGRRAGPPIREQTGEVCTRWPGWQLGQDVLQICPRVEPRVASPKPRCSGLWDLQDTGSPINVVERQANEFSTPSPYRVAR